MFLKVLYQPPLFQELHFKFKLKKNCFRVAPLGEQVNMLRTIEVLTPIERYVLETITNPEFFTKMNRYFAMDEANKLYMITKFQFYRVSSIFLSTNHFNSAPISILRSCFIVTHQKSNWNVAPEQKGDHFLHNAFYISKLGRRREISQHDDNWNGDWIEILSMGSAEGNLEMVHSDFHTDFRKHQRKHFFI